MTPELFQAATGCSKALAEKWASPITAAMYEFNIDSPKRQAAFLAQVGHESGGFVYVREIWGPTNYQLAYEGSTVLGNTEPGDGHRFLGRGLIQTTGRYNYAKTGKALGLDLIAHPELLEEPLNAARSAGVYWRDRRCNIYADQNDFVGLTRVINGPGLLGLGDRQVRWGVAKKALGVTT